MTRKIYQWLAIAVLPVLACCYPKGAEYTEELDLVYTNYSKDFDFKGNTTYAIPDSVIKITGDNFDDPDGDGRPQFVSSTYSTVIIAKLKENLNAYGWTQVNKNNNPDVIILPSTMTTTNIYYYYDWWYWGWWYPYWDPWYGWYYPGSYYPAYVTGYRSGSVFVQMVDNTKPLLSGDNVPVVWSCILNGLAEGSTTNITTRIQSSLDIAFGQSPYLKH
jgi:hypothetical protein